MIFLISNVIYELSGSFFEKWGMAFSKHGKSAGVSECEVISAEPVIEDFDKKKACIVLPEVWLGGPLPQRPQPPRKEQKVIMGYVSLTIYREFPASKFLRALPYRACGTRCSGPPGYFPRLAISSSAPAALRRAVFCPLQLPKNQRPRKAEITFETFSTTSNVVLLRSYVSIRACGRFFMTCA